MSFGLSPSREGASRNYFIINFGAVFILMDEVNLMLAVACSGCPSDSRLEEKALHATILIKLGGGVPAYILMDEVNLMLVIACR